MSQARDFADSFSAVSTGRRNLIINGAMQVAQRGTSKTGITTQGFYALDRANTMVSSCGTYTVSQESDAPEGLVNSYKILTTTANSSPAAGGFVFLQTKFEGQDLQHLKYGTSNAVTTTLSFWVKSSETGTGVLGVQHNDNTASRFIRNYTINAADTWEYKTITVPGRTDGAIDDDNTPSIQLQWWLGSGSDFTGTDKTGEDWHTNTNPARNNGGTLDINDVANRYWQITGIQWEVGNTASPFEHRSYGEELALCQRYFYAEDQSDTYHAISNGFYSSTTNVITVKDLPIPMRAGPSLSVSGSWQAAGTNGIDASSLIIVDSTGTDIQTVQIRATVSGATAGQGTNLRNKNDATATFHLDAEL